MKTGDSTGPTTEQGYSTAYPITWSMWSSDMEESAGDLRWPNSIKIYHQMRTDAQLFALLNAITLPIRSSRWVIDPNGAADEAVELAANGLGLPIRGQEEPAPRGRIRFSHDEHLVHALLPLIYGFIYFEQVGAFLPGPNGKLQWQLQKLAPRMPQSIFKIDVDNQGGLQSITQYPQPGQPSTGVAIPVNRLAPYVWNKEGANWTGRSMLRACYKHWLLKDRLIRVDAMKNERFGMGIPVANAPLGATRETVLQYAAMARAARGDPQAGVGLPAGGNFKIEGVSGTLPDILASIEYHDEQMARNFLAMFLSLGQTKTGSRNLGESFVDFFKMGVDATANWYAQNTNKYVIEDMIDWNFGIDANAPLITYDEDPESRMDATDLVKLIEGGAIVVDNELRTWISDRWGVSDPGPGTPTPPGPSPTVTAVPAPLPGEIIPILPPAKSAAEARARRAEERRREAWDAQFNA
jgi:hypothetical protein